MSLNFNPIVRWAITRINKNKNAIIIINGETGSGKTYSGIDLADKIAGGMGTPFTADDNIAFDISALLKKTEKPINTRAGTCFVFEEVGAMGGGGSSREFQSKANKGFFSFLQTTRHRRQILILTTPYFAFLEAGARKLCHMQLDMVKIDFKQKKAILKPYIIQVNSRTGKMYFKYMRITQDGDRIKFNRLKLDYPRQELVDRYEEMKTEYTTALNKKIIKENDPLQEIKTPHKIIQMDTLKTLIEEGFGATKIAKTMNVSRSTIIKYTKVLKSINKDIENTLIKPTGSVSESVISPNTASKSIWVEET